MLYKDPLPVLMKPRLPTRRTLEKLCARHNPHRQGPRKENTTKKKKKNTNNNAIPVDSRDAQANNDSSGEDTATQSTNISKDIDPETHSISQGTDVISNYTYLTERDGENLRNYSNDELVANIINRLQDVSTYIGYMKTVQPDLLYNGRIASLVNSIAEDTILSKLHTLTNAVTNLTSTVRDIQDTVKPHTPHVPRRHRENDLWVKRPMLCMAIPRHFDSASCTSC
ncbi:hypothetical protein BKA70DRAFT_1236630 [Coprinopsis sp. MPI-PUGE-AT-0042]|nr:hypothetical protein BKA70DRAFT_1236630 [Coprinopsis sp. MPI-PUGE-AT-0042]